MLEKGKLRQKNKERQKANEEKIGRQKWKREEKY
jgi:hypothetical protein